MLEEKYDLVKDLGELGFHDRFHMTLSLASHSSMKVTIEKYYDLVFNADHINSDVLDLIVSELYDLYEHHNIIPPDGVKGSLLRKAFFEHAANAKNLRLFSNGWLNDVLGKSWLKLTNTNVLPKLDHMTGSVRVYVDTIESFSYTKGINEFGIYNL